ncbi:hypothetical protein EC957_007111, partial [Mortierella hygrophila]
MLGPEPNSLPLLRDNPFVENSDVDSLDDEDMNTYDFNEPFDDAGSCLSDDVAQQCKEVLNGVYRAVFMTPEIIFSANQLEALWDMDNWKKRLMAIVIDEAHCINTWGKDFRQDYDRIGDLRARVLPTVAFIAVSATLPEEVLGDVEKSLHFRNVKIINVGNDRPNIRYEVLHWEHSNSEKDGYKDLEFVLDMKKTIVYFDNLNETDSAYRYLQQKAGSYRHKVALFHAKMSSEHNERAMAKFRAGDVMVLLATEAAGMGCDVRDVARVKRKHANKDIDFFIKTTGCRRAVLDEKFGNTSEPNKNCCDNCHPTKGTIRSKEITFVEVSAKPLTANRSATRTTEQKEQAKDIILAWRERMHEEIYAELSLLTVNPGTLCCPKTQIFSRLIRL